MSSPIVCLEQVSRIFRTGVQEVAALQGVSMTIRQPALVVIAGPSGSGKTTLLNLIGGLDRPTAGSVEVEGMRLEDRDERGLALYRRHRVGFVFQGHNLLPTLTTAENVELPLILTGAMRRRDRVLEMLSRVGLAARAGDYPQHLSAGQQQRVAIARALVHSPALVLADEPTANLDSRSAQGLFELLDELHHTTGAAILMATHDSRLIERCKKVVLLEDGRRKDGEREV